VIPVWAWILLWTLLVIALLVMLTVFAIRLFRKLMRTLGALEDLGDQLAELDIDAESPRAHFRPAVFQNRRVLAAAIDQARLQRVHRRAQRRDLAIGRGKLLQHSPYKPEDRPSC
jgi:hypothetical protein